MARIEFGTGRGLLSSSGSGLGTVGSAQVERRVKMGPTSMSSPPARISAPISAICSFAAARRCAFFHPLAATICATPMRPNRPGCAAMRFASAPVSESSLSASLSSGVGARTGAAFFFSFGLAITVEPSTSLTSPVGSLIGRRPTSSVSLSSSSSCSAQRARPATSYSASSSVRFLRFRGASSSDSDSSSETSSNSALSADWSESSPSSLSSLPSSESPSEPMSESMSSSDPRSEPDSAPAALRSSSEKSTSESKSSKS